VDLTGLLNAPEKESRKNLEIGIYKPENIFPGPFCPPFLG
jgi:hypothetical protein